MKKTILPLLASLTLCTSALGVQAFAADDTVTPDPASATTDITAKLTLPTGGGTVVPPIIDPTDPSKPGGDNGTGIQGNFGIAYVPNALTGQAELATSGSQDVSLTDANSNTKFNVGVKDTLRKKHSWDLKASISWDDSYMEGTTFKGTNAKVSENNNGTLGNVGNVNGIQDKTNGNLEIDDTEKSIFGSNGTATTNGVYNYGFENPTLNIPNVENVPAGSYSGDITWNLELTPTTPVP